MNSAMKLPETAFRLLSALVLLAVHVTAQQSNSRCSTFGTLHLLTFDGSFVDNQGPCTYDLVKSCSSFVINTFQVRIKNTAMYPHMEDSAVSLLYVEVSAENRMVQVYKNGTVLVQDVAYNDYNYKCRLSVQRVSSGWQVTLSSSGVLVGITKEGLVTVSVPSSYMGELCGLCGNYNGLSSDDDHNSTSSLVPEPFQDGTCATGRSASVSGWCRKMKQVGDTLDLPEYCGLFSVSADYSPFNECLQRENLTNYFYQRCAYDFCESLLSQNESDDAADGLSSGCGLESDCTVNNVTTKAAVCRLAEALANECTARGHSPADWRKYAGCDLQCPGNSKYSANLSSPSIPASCVSRDCQASTLVAAAIALDGCQCPAGQVWLGSGCVPEKSGCSRSCSYAGSAIYQDGAQWLDAMCSANITCKNGTLRYVQTSCADGAVCVTLQGKSYCACPSDHFGDGITSCIYYCPAGHIPNSNNAECVECPVGTYQPLAGQTTCIACGLGLVTQVRGSTSQESCVGAFQLIPDDPSAEAHNDYDQVYQVAVSDLVLPNGIPFGNTFYRNLSISSNGIVTFGSTGFVGRNPTDLTKVQQSMIAPLWYRQDLRRTGRSFLKISPYSCTAGSNSGDDSGVSVARIQLISRVLSLTGKVPATFVIKWAMTVTWAESVGYPIDWYSSNGVHQNATYQLAMATNGQTTYVLFIYSLDHISLSSNNLARKIYMGYNDGKRGYTFYASGTKNIVQIDRLQSNTDQPGVWLFEFASVLQESAQGLYCLKWYNTEAALSKGVGTAARSAPCPCNARLAKNNPLFIWNVTSSCAVTMTPGVFAYYQMCCYSKGQGNLVTSDPTTAGDQEAGRPLKRNPYSNYGLYLVDDYQPYFNCCIGSDYCRLYRLVRPADDCGKYAPPQAASAYGDPHFVLLDSGISYTYNPIGEFHLIKSSSMEIQVRMGFSSFVGLDAGATLFLAVAAKAQPNNSSRVHVEMSQNGTGLLIYVSRADGSNDQSYSSLFSTGAPDGTFHQFDDVSILKSSGSLVVSFSTGYTLSITLNAAGMLGVKTYIPSTELGLCYGLLGLYDGNITNDLMLSNGTIINCPLVDSGSGTYYDSQCIYTNFGESWRIRPNESIFWYWSNVGTNSYTNTAFVPVFQVPSNDTYAALICNNDLACLYDFAVTNRSSVASATRDLTMENTNTRTILAYTPPKINGLAMWNARIGIPLSYTYTIDYARNSTVELVFIERPAGCTIESINASDYYITWLPQSENLLDNHTLRMVAIDNLANGGSSAEFVVQIRLCIDCNYHGHCNYTTINSNGYNSDNFIVYGCICNDADWSGDDCSVQAETCESTCASGSSDCQTQYTCSNVTCGPGYVSSLVIDANGTVYDANGVAEWYCFDDDECVRGIALCGANSDCVNIPGSYDCACSKGYQQVPGGNGSCSDVNECTTGTAGCEQICINTYGSYICACYEGFKLVNGTGLCKNATNTGGICDQLQLNCSYTCSNETTPIGEWQCICPRGSTFLDSSTRNAGSPCIDVNECLPDSGAMCQPPGASICINAASGYSCGCQVGYALNGDGLTCTGCPAGTFGTACSSPCDCGDRASNCDPVLGCTNCTAGWSGQDLQCRMDVDECQAAVFPCPSNSLCTNTNGSYWCSCKLGYMALSAHGATTCTDVDECRSYSPCSTYATCHNMLGSYSCSCMPGYKGDGFTCTDIQECLLQETDGIPYCDDLALCVNTVGSYLCTCPAGYYGDGLPGDCLDIDECVSSDVCPIQRNLTCNNVPGSYYCSCVDGYRRTAQLASVKPLDSCDAVPCHGLDWGYCSRPNQECINQSTTNIYVCECIAGYQLVSGSGCLEKNQCVDNSTCASLLNTECINITTGIQKCICKAGYESNSSTNGSCQDVNECASSVSNNCSSAELCVNTEGSFHCDCNVGYRRSANGSCLNVDKCDQMATNNCSSVETCVNTEGSFRCDCKQGYYKSTNGSCLNTDECDQMAANNCSSVETCINTEGSFRCDCKQGYNRSTNGSCLHVDKCAESFSNNCATVEVCISLESSYQCVCREGYQAATNGSCLDVNECSASPSNNCSSSELCINTDGSFHCDCAGGYNRSSSGSCMDINECAQSATNNCSSIESCINTAGSYHCHCNAGYNRSSSGSCMDINECEQMTPQATNCSTDAHEICNNTVGSFTCLCAAGFYRGNASLRCQDINECVNLTNGPCTQNEICNNTEGGYYCSCSPGYMHKNTADGCVDIDECQSQRNNCSTDSSQCNNTIGSYDCKCLPGYTSTVPPSNHCQLSQGVATILVIQIFVIPADLASNPAILKVLLQDALAVLFEPVFVGFTGVHIIRIVSVQISQGNDGSIAQIRAQIVPDSSVNVTYEIVYNGSVDAVNQILNVYASLYKANNTLNLNGTLVQVNGEPFLVLNDSVSIAVKCPTMVTCPDTLVCIDNRCQQSANNQSLVDVSTESMDHVSSESVARMSTLHPTIESFQAVMDFTAIWAAVGVAGGLLVAGLIACVTVVACKRKQGEVTLHRERRGPRLFQTDSRRPPALTNFHSAVSSSRSARDSSSNTSDTASTLSYENSGYGRNDASEPFAPRWPRAYKPERATFVSRRHSNTGSNDE